MTKTRMPAQNTRSLQAFRSSRAYRMGSLLRRLHLGLTDQVEAGLHAEGLQLTRTQALALLLLVEHPGASNADLARLNGVSPQTMHQVMARLEREGLVTRAPHPRLRRVQAFAATQRGHDMVVRGSPVARTEIQRSLRALRAAEQDQLIALLERCVAGLDAHGRR